jgi:hypothetical protein
MKSSESLYLPAAVLLDNVRSMYNVGAFFRAADGAGLQKLCLCGITAHPSLGLRIKKAISKTALGAEETVAWEHDWDAVHMAEDRDDAVMRSTVLYARSSPVIFSKRHIDNRLRTGVHQFSVSHRAKEIHH